VARGAASSGLTLFADQDQVGLWVFSSELNGTLPYREVVPIGALDTAVSGTPRRLLVERTLKSLRARGATGSTTARGRRTGGWSGATSPR
jgi:hypothetical protein